MEFLKSIKRRRSFVSNLAYMTLNIGLALTLLVIVRTTDALWLAFTLVLLSKWRVLAVRPRYWMANIQANLVDIIVSLGLVSIMASLEPVEPAQFVVQVIITLAYIGWLLYLKPRSKRKAIVQQAGAALLVGVTAVFLQAHAWPATVVVLAMWVIGYSTARHVLAHYEEDHLLFLSLVWGLFLAELGWVAYHWIIAYTLPLTGGNQLPQISIITLTIGFLVYKAYDSYARFGRIRSADITPPTLFAVSIIAILILFFNAVKIGSI